jgi:CO/xanthine dehydrogenase FAD-binding subunit
MDIATIGCGAGIRLEDRRISELKLAFTVAAPTPVRARKAEDFLKGKPLSDDVLAEAGRIAASPDCCTPRDSLRCAAWYRREIIEVSVLRMAKLAASRIKGR